MEQNIRTMRRSLLLFAIVVAAFSGCKTRQEAETTPEWTPLMNGIDLTGWDTYLGPVFDTLTGEQVGAPIGLNTDPQNTFSIIKEDNQPVLRVSGQYFGGISTQTEFSNYHLRLEFKWGELKWAPRKNAKRDSGLLYHAVGAQGAGYGFWLRSQEFQVQEGDLGDYWSVAQSIIDVPATEFDSGLFRYDPAGQLQTFGKGKGEELRCYKNPDAEKPTGEWNVLEVYCFGDTSVHVVNGKTVMVLFNSRQPGEAGDELPLTKGKIQLQSEGAEVFYRDIEIRSITGLPEAVLVKGDK